MASACSPAAIGERLTPYLSGKFTGSIDKAQLARLATAVYEQLGIP